MSNRLPVGYRFYWDEECRLCNTCKRLAVALDWSKKVYFLPLQSEAAELDLGHLSYEEMMASSHLVTPQAQVHSGGQGILHLGALLPMVAPLVFLFRLLPKNDLLAAKLYKLVASNRGVPYGGSCKVSFDSPEDNQ